MKESDFASFTVTAIQHRILEKFRRKYGYGIARKGRLQGGDTRSGSSHGVNPVRMGDWRITLGDKTGSLVVTRQDGKEFLIDTDHERTHMCWLHV